MRSARRRGRGFARLGRGFGSGSGVSVGVGSGFLVLSAIALASSAGASLGVALAWLPLASDISLLFAWGLGRGEARQMRPEISGRNIIDDFHRVGRDRLIDFGEVAWAR